MFVVLYTFSFKTNSSDNDNEYLMLVASIRSLLDTLVEPHAPGDLAVLVYTTQEKVKIMLISDFDPVENPVRVNVISPKITSCQINENSFTAIGHERVFAIPDLLAAGHTVLYLDNDTLLLPGVWESLKAQHLPKAYTNEAWQTMSSWLKRLKKFDSVISEFPHISKYIDRAIVNNGVQFYPQYSTLSHQIANRTKDIYISLERATGYSYGYDQVAFSLAVYDIHPNIETFYNNAFCQDIWHAYQSKKHFSSNLKFIGLQVSPEGSNVKKIFNIYDKLHQDAKSKGIIDSYDFLLRK